MPNLPHLLLWTDSPGPYIDAIANAGLSDRVAIETLGRREKPSDTQRAETNVLLAAGVPPGVLPTMPNLKWAQSLTAGVEGWLALPDLPPNLTLTCARGTHRESMPENILARAVPHHQTLRRHRRGPEAKPLAPARRPPLNGKTLGILGLGAVGQEVARLATALGMRVIGTKRRPEPMPGLADVLPPERTNEILAQSDFVLLLLPATPETDNFINAERLGRMKPSAWLLNFGRGHLIKDDDLIAAVRAKTIAGAVLDVFRQEPLPKEHKFWTTEGILVLPHIGGPHPQRDSIVARLFVENLGRFLDGQPLKEVVDRAAGY